MSNQETSFVTIGQRVLANPLRYASWFISFYIHGVAMHCLLVLLLSIFGLCESSSHLFCSSECYYSKMLALSFFFPEPSLFRVRFHYGHPDVFDRLFHVTRGGVSKASKIINLSEDIFAGTFLLLLLVNICKCGTVMIILWLLMVQDSIPHCVKAMLLTMNTCKLAREGMWVSIKYLCLRQR